METRRQKGTARSWGVRDTQIASQIDKTEAITEHTERKGVP